MIVKARIAGVFTDAPIVATGEVELEENTDLKRFFEQADRAFGFRRPEYFRLALKMRNEPTILLNGDRLDLPEGFQHPLKHGDEITVLAPMTGG